MRIGCIGGEDMTTLMHLAGVTCCRSGKNIEKEFEEMVKEVDILIIEEEYAEKIKDKILYHRLIYDTPVIVEVPGKKKIEREDSIRKIIVRAVGVDIGD